MWLDLKSQLGFVIGWISKFWPMTQLSKFLKVLSWVLTIITGIKIINCLCDIFGFLKRWKYKNYTNWNTNLHPLPMPTSDWRFTWSSQTKTLAVCESFRKQTAHRDNLIRVSYLLGSLIFVKQLRARVYLHDRCVAFVTYTMACAYA